MFCFMCVLIRFLLLNLGKMPVFLKDLMKLIEPNLRVWIDNNLYAIMTYIRWSDAFLISLNNLTQATNILSQEVEKKYIFCKVARPPRFLSSSISNVKKMSFPVLPIKTHHRNIQSNFFAISYNWKSDQKQLV